MISYQSGRTQKKRRDMGKYIRKPKTTRDVSLMDLSQSSLGVRTRAKTLALQRLQSSAASPPPKTDYLQLRSRRLEKPPPRLWQHLKNSRKTPVSPKQGLVCGDGENPRADSLPLPIAPEKEDEGGLGIGDSEIEASLGENNLDLEARERSTRESTPCSLIRTADSISTPESSTKRRNPSVSNQSAQDALLRSIPTSREMDEFFTRAEQPQQRHFVEKYNFDIVKDLPLPGRYDWVRVTP